MAANQCLINSQGQRALRSALEKLNIDPDNKSALSERMKEEGTQVHRITLRKILEDPEPVWLKKLEDIFYWVNQQLEAQNLDRCPLRDSYYEEVEQSPTTRRKSQASSKTSQVISTPEQQLTQLLWTLDCSRQQGGFTTSSSYLDPAGAFLIRAKDVKLEKWLVKRFARQIPGSGKAICHGIFIPRHPMRSNFSDFWEDLGRKFQAMPKRRSIIDAIATRCESQTVILALYGIQKLDQNKVHNLIEFWQELVVEVKARSRTFDTRLILFLSTDLGDCGDLKMVKEFNPQSPSTPVALEPLVWINNQEVINWLGLDDIKPTLVQLIGEAGVASLVSDIRQCNPQQHSPLQPIREICWACQLDLAHIETSWELSA